MLANKFDDDGNGVLDDEERTELRKKMVEKTVAEYRRLPRAKGKQTEELIKDFTVRLFSQFSQLSCSPLLTLLFPCLSASRSTSSRPCAPPTSTRSSTSSRSRCERFGSPSALTSCSFCSLLTFCSLLAHFLLTFRSHSAHFWGTDADLLHLQLNKDGDGPAALGGEPTRQDHRSV